MRNHVEPSLVGHAWQETRERFQRLRAKHREMPGYEEAEWEELDEKITRLAALSNRVRKVKAS